jgi:Acetyltransferase (GNAT) domain
MISPAPSRIVRVTSPAPRGVWRELLAVTPGALAFQTPEWIDCVCAAGGFSDASRLYDIDGGEQVLMPLLRRTKLPSHWAVQASLPYGWGFGGALTSEGATTHDLAAAIAELSRQTTVRTSIRPNPFTAADWQAAVPRGTIELARRAHILDLGGGVESVFAHRFKGRARTAIRRAERASLQIECDTSGRLLPAFYGLYRRSLERWASASPLPTGLAYRLGVRRDPPAKFAAVVAGMGDSCRIWLAWHAGVPAAALVCLVRGKVASYWRGCVDVEVADRTYATYLLQRAAIEDACASGCSHYHMGESGNSASLAQFKRAFGAEPYDYREYRFERMPLTATERSLRSFVTRAGRLVSSRRA